MYCEGEYVIYGMNGVCRVNAISHTLYCLLQLLYFLDNTC